MYKQTNKQTQINFLIVNLSLLSYLIYLICYLLGISRPVVLH